MVPGALKPAFEIDFIVAGGARYGLGHVMRSGALAAAAVRRGWRVRSFLAGDRVANERWQAACPASVVVPWSAWRASASAALTLFDHPFVKSRWIAACRRDRTRTIVLDDVRAVGRARLTINPALHHLRPPIDSSAPDEEEENGEDDPSALVLRGPRYAILSEAHSATTARPLEERDALLLSIGGADPRAAAPRLAPILSTALARAGSETGIVNRRVVLGPAFEDPGERAARDLTRAGWTVDRALEPAAMARRMAEARLAVVGFGTSLCELAWHGTPHLSVTHHPSDEAWARALEEQGIGGWLGPATDFDPEFVAQRFAQALRDPDWARTSARRAREALEEGNGCERILDRLSIIAREAAATRPRSERDRGSRPTPGA